MTAPGAKLTCDERGCKSTFVSTKNQERHMKEKHGHLLPGTSKQADAVIAISQDTPAFSHDDEEAKEDQLLLDELDKIENDIKDNNSDSTEKIIETVERLRVVIKKKSDVQKDLKSKFEDEMSKRNQVEESLKDELKNLEQLKRDTQTQRDRNMAIMRESKKKKATIKTLERETVEFKKELNVLRVKIGVVAEENSTLKIENRNKTKYIMQLEESNGVDTDDVSEVVEVSEDPVRVEMNKDSQAHVCNACARTFRNSKDLDRHMEAKHSPARCAFCDEEFRNQKELEEHIDQCLDYGNTTVKCSKCKQIFTRFGIKRHVENCHEDTYKNIYSCSVCGKRSKSAEEIKKHQQTDHMEQVEVSKEVCKHWRRGKCFKGSSCSFSHVGFQNLTSSGPTTKQGTSSNWTAPCKHGDSCSWMKKGSCRFFHKGVGVQMPARGTSGDSQGQQIRNQRGTKLCRYNERCYKKSTCGFEHTNVQDFPPLTRQQRLPMRVLKVGRSNQ